MNGKYIVLVNDKPIAVEVYKRNKLVYTFDLKNKNPKGEYETNPVFTKILYGGILYIEFARKRIKLTKLTSIIYGVN